MLAHRGRRRRRLRLRLLLRRFRRRRRFRLHRHARHATGRVSLCGFRLVLNGLRRESAARAGAMSESTVSVSLAGDADATARVGGDVGTNEATTTTQGDNRARLLIGAHDPLTRRWANANFFTAGTDKGWFEDSGFSRWLQHIGKGDMRVATREEWQKVRRKLPKTRRLSLKFLKDERVDLEYFRHAAREMTNLKLHGTVLTDELKALMLKWTGGVPVPSPLEVGQTVLAVHPRFHSPYIGNILIVERATCRVQFARPELGVELVRDIDIMPVDANQEEMDLIAAGTAEQIENEAFNAGFRGIYDPLPVVGGGGHAYGAGVAVAAQMREMDVRLLNEAQQALERKRELVDSVELFRALSPEHKATIADALKCEVFDEGDVVITEGETGDRFYVVSSGTFIFVL